MSHEIGQHGGHNNPEQVCSSSDHLVTSAVHILPPEILIRVFYLVCNLRTYHMCPATIHHERLQKTSRPFFKQPVILSHVCTRWRYIALDSASLWSHIDLFPDQFHDPLLSARLEAYAARSSQTRLEVHVIIHPKSIPEYLTHSTTSIDDNQDKTIFPFLTAVAPRIQSLVISSNPAYRNYFGDSVGAICLAHCVPRTLTEISCEGNIDLEDPRAVIRERHLPESVIDDLWLHVSVLQLWECYIPWESKAYHGLTELRLTNYTYDTVSSSKLISIFQSSPQLRVFELDTFENDDSENSPVTALSLDELEVLILVGLPDYHLGSVLRLIAPGLGPLSLSTSSSAKFICKFELQNFIARSNITQFCANSFTSYSDLAQVLNLMPSTRVLAIDSFAWDKAEEDDKLPANSTLDTLYVIRSPGIPTLAWAGIEMLVKQYKLQKLILWWSNFICEEPQADELGQENYLEIIRAICPVVKIIPDNEPNPIEEWYYRGLHNYFP